MHLHQVHLITVVDPVGKDDVHCDQVLQVHTQDGDFEALAFIEGLSVTGVVVVGRDQLSHLTPDLGRGVGNVWVYIIIKSQSEWCGNSCV